MLLAQLVMIKRVTSGETRQDTTNHPCILLLPPMPIAEAWLCQTSLQISFASKSEAKFRAFRKNYCTLFKCLCTWTKYYHTLHKKLPGWIIDFRQDPTLLSFTNDCNYNMGEIIIQFIPEYFCGASNVCTRH